MEHSRRQANHNHFVNASTPSLGLAMHTGEIQSPSVGPVGLASVMFHATLTVATSNQLPAHQGASLSTPVMCNRTRTRTRTRTGFIQNQNRIVARPMAVIQTLMCFALMRMGQRIASKIATVLKKATHVR